MYADKKFLSLMIMTLCFASVRTGSFDSNFLNPETEEELDNLVKESDNNQKLSVLYFVMDNTDDPLLNELTETFPDAVFIKVDRTVVKFMGQVIEIERQPEIMFHKFELDEIPFFCNNQSQLEMLIQQRIDLNKSQYMQLFTADGIEGKSETENQSHTGDQSHTEVHHYHNHLYNIILRPKNADELYKILQEAYDNETLCLMYLVSNTYEYDEMFNKSARQHSLTTFVKVDTSKITEINGLNLNVSTQPSIVFYKYGHITNPYSSTNQDLLGPKISDYESQLKKTFTRTFKSQLQIDAANQSHTREKQQTQVHFDNEIQRPLDNDSLINLMQAADENGKLCFIYLVINTNEYDEVFNNLAKTFSSTVFVKIDTSIFTPVNDYKFNVGTQPKIYFYKFKHTTISFSSTDVEVLSNKIRYFEKIQEPELS